MDSQNQTIPTTPVANGEKSRLDRWGIRNPSEVGSEATPQRRGTHDFDHQVKIALQ